MIEESKKQVTFPVMRVTQPIGEFFIGSMNARDLVDISWFDIRQLNRSGNVDKYLGIQRKISQKRVAKISEYVGTVDATFPTSVLLAVEAKCAELESSVNGDNRFGLMTLRNDPGEFNNPETVLYRDIARVLDGQHRIQGLAQSKIDLESFEINVAIFVGADIADQASIFSIVNKAQTKVNTSLVYDLFEYSKTRSPEKSCHNVAVALDQSERSPLYSSIKRLGVATDGRFEETLSQATVVRSILDYVSDNPLKDRDIGKRGGSWPAAPEAKRDKLIFREWFVDDRDELITLQLMNYFEAVRRRWEDAWSADASVRMIRRTNGFRGFMRFLRPAFNACYRGDVVKMSEFLSVFENVDLPDAEFTTDVFKPGTTGETRLYKVLMERSGLAGPAFD